jgi:Flp pilus assembly protein TadD
MHVAGRLPSADLLVMAAGLHEQSGRRDEARQLLARALEIDPRNAKGLKLVEKLRP